MDFEELQTQTIDKKKDSSSSYVWYLSYGSNLCKERFMCYIKGGQIFGMRRECSGARDKADPVQDTYYKIPHELYFAKSSGTWGGGGAAFLCTKRHNDSHKSSHGRMYLITKEQFLDVVEQENGSRLTVNFEEVKSKAQINYFGEWYGTILYLGEHEGSPIYTFTNGKQLEEVNDINHPTNDYVRVITVGLKQLKFEEHEILQYFLTKKGVHKKEMIEHVVKNSHSDYFVN